MSLCVYFGDECSGLARDGKKLCDSHQRVFTNLIDSPTPAVLSQIPPVPPLSVFFAFRRGTGAEGLSAEQIRLIRGGFMD